MLLDAVAGAGLELIETPPGFGYTDNGNVEPAVLYHRLQLREDLLVGEVARGAEEHKGIRANCFHRRVSNVWPVFRGVRRIGIAWPRAACPGSLPRRGN